MKPKTDKEIQSMRESGKMLATVLQYLTTKIAPGITTAELDVLADEELKRLGGKPAFLGYQGFPAVICISVNDAVVHGIPSDYELKEGDLVSLDFGVNYQDLITDACITVGVGRIAAKSRQLIEDTKKSLEIGISTVKSGSKVSDIGAAIEDFLTPRGYGIVHQLVGHGVGRKLHEPPEVPHFRDRGGPEFTLQTNMTIAIEPMVTLGSGEVYIDEDRWTVKSLDGSLSAQFEHTVLVTDSGSEVLTQL